jgi:hypothetical protein
MPAGITASEVYTWTKVTPPGIADPTMTMVVETVNSYVSRLPVLVDLGLSADAAWPHDVKMGAVMLAARYHRRRNSASGVEAITESGAQYVSRYDSDISRLLRLDQFQSPRIG